MDCSPVLGSRKLLTFISGQGYGDSPHLVNDSWTPTMTTGLREVVDMILSYENYNSLNSQSLIEDTSSVNVTTTSQDVPSPDEPLRPANFSEDQDPVLFLFLFYTIIMGPVCIMGFVGNTVSIMVLSKDRNHRVVTFLLKCLALADNLVLTVSFVTLSMIFGLLYYVKGTSVLTATRPYIVKYVHPIGYISQTLTIWLTVLLAINRYVAICRPFDVHKFCTIRKAQIQVLACVFITVLINSPRFFQYHIVTVTQGNSTYLSVNDSTTIGETTLFGMIVTNGLFTIVVLVLPLILLLIVNSKLISELQSMRRRISRTSGYNDKYPDGERNITMVMIIIIVVLLVCHTPDRVAQLLRVIVSNGNREYPKFTFIFTNIANFLIVLNSSTNFLIYYFLRQRFRQIFKAAFSFGCKQKPTYADDDKGFSIQSTPLTDQCIAKTLVDNDAQIKMIANGKGI